MKRHTKIVVAAFGLFVGLVPISGLGTNSPIVRAQELGTPTPARTTQTPYFTVTTRVLPGGPSVDQYIINGPPVPPPGYAAERSARALPRRDLASGINALAVPAYNWVFGCSSVSGAMIAGYYDENGFPNLYTGPANGGVAPLDNSVWPTWTDRAGATYPNLPIAASHQGVDGRTGRGSIDDYWVQYNSTAQDPYITNGWAAHAWGDAIGDYMKTSQSAYDNVDGSTNFYNWTNSSAPLTCAEMVTNRIDTKDGTYGRKLFYEARGYTVTDCYNQKTDNNGGGFTFASYRAEIDAGHPVMLNLAGHTIVGVGYDASSNTVYLHDTWDYNTHTMAWGGSYLGMLLQSVSIVNLQTQPALPPKFYKTSPANAATGQPTNLTLSWGTSSGATSYEYCYDATNDNACGGMWTSTGTATSASLSGLSAGATYYWQVRARNTAGTTDADNGTWWSFTTQNDLPGAFSKTEPTNGAIGQPSNPTLTWGTSSGATSYEYCLDTTDNNSCTGAWVSTSSTSAALGCCLGDGTVYYWQVRARNVAGTTESNGGTWWTFTSQNPAPASFDKTSPPNGATDQPTSLFLSWAPSSWATSYEYCYDTTNSNSCANTWASTTSTSAALTGLNNGTTYYWQVRGRNAGGIIDANGGAWWSFTTTQTSPGAFSKMAPANGAADQPTNPTLTWTTSSGATSYEYCYDTIDDNACYGNWISAGSSNSVDLNGLSAGANYYWHVRSRNAVGTTDSNGGWWNFTTANFPAPNVYTYLPVIVRDVAGTSPRQTLTPRSTGP